VTRGKTRKRPVDPADQMVFVAVKKLVPFLVRRFFTATGNPKETDEAAKGLYEQSGGDL
jgi:hypothetical protein